MAVVHVVGKTLLMQSVLLSCMLVFGVFCEVSGLIVVCIAEMLLLRMLLLML